MECNCNNNNNRAVIPWVRGNRLPLVICVYEDVVTQEGEGSLVHNKMERVPYEIQAADTVTVVMKSGFRQVEMPFTTEGNKVLVTDNGELAAGTYTVEVTIVRGDGARGRWQETRQVRVYENTSDAQLGEMYAIEADLFFYAKGDTGNGIADITANPDDTLTITMTDGTTYTTQAMKGDKGDKGDQGEKGTSIVSFDVTGQTDTSVIYTVTFSDDTTEEVAVPKGPQGDTGLTGNGIASTTLNSDYTLTIAYTDGTTYTTPSIRGAQGVQGVSIIAFTQTGETATNTLYNVVFSDGRTQSVAIPKGVKGDKGDTGDPGSQGAQGIQGIQGPQGERGPQGNTGVQVDSVASIIHSIDPTATYAAADVAGADAVQDVLAEVTELAGIDDEPTAGSNNMVRSGGVKAVMTGSATQTVFRGVYTESNPVIDSGNASDQIAYVPVKQGLVVHLHGTGLYNPTILYGFMSDVPAVGKTVSNITTFVGNTIDTDVTCPIDGYLVIWHVNYRFQDLVVSCDKWTLITPSSTLDNKGDYTLNVGGNPYAYAPSRYKLIKLSGWSTSRSVAMPNIGDYGYVVDPNKVYKRYGAGYSEVEEIPYYDGALYTYRNEIFVWNGTELVESTLKYKELIPQWNLGASLDTFIITNIIVTSGSTYRQSDGDKSIILPVKEGDVINIKTGSKAPRLGFCASFPTLGDSALETYNLNANTTYKKIAPSNAKYVIINTTSIDTFEDVAPIGLSINDYDFKSNINEHITELESLSFESLSFDIADGKLRHTGTYQSELECSPIINSSADAYIGYKKAKQKTKINSQFDNIVAFNLDDLAPSDYVGNRKIFNKYGFNANFNYILSPFANLSGKENMISNVKKLINDGNALGLHAILSKSYWIVNKCFDIRPAHSESLFTFAPSLYDISHIVADGKNVFGTTITESTKASDAGYSDIPSGVTDAKILEMTESQLKQITRCFTIYGDQYRTIQGLDLDDNVVVKTPLSWLEYWYNNLIDSSLGYSSELEDMPAKYGVDYECPNNDAGSYYPRKAQLLSGKVVFYDDTSNPHYAEALVATDVNFNENSWQLVGRFKKGLFKGSATCLNYEVIDRCIQIAKAFIRHYFGVDNITSHNRHGIGDFTKYWIDEDGFGFDDSDKKIPTGKSGIIFRTRDMSFVSVNDILVAEGIRMINERLRTSYGLNGEIGLYFGQKGIRSDNFNNIANGEGGFVDYLSFFGNSGIEEMTYENFKTFTEGIDDWLKFAYENAGQTLTRNGVTYQVFPWIKGAINNIRCCIGTGKVPVFSVDTIRKNPSISTALDLVLRYCYMNNIRVVPMEEARRICISNGRGYMRNYMPNPAFNQSLIQMFGDCSDKKAYIPDGWTYGGYGEITDIIIEKRLINNNQELVMQLVGTSPNIYTKIYGLAPGNYKFSCYVKGGSVTLQKRTTGMKWDDTTTNRQDVYGGDDFTYREIQFSIPEPTHSVIDRTSVVSQLCQGYTDNVDCIRINLWSRGAIAIALPKIELV